MTNALPNFGAIGLDIQTRLTNLEKIVPNEAPAHNAFWGGRNLTDKYSVDEISAKLTVGDFSDLYIGDYITKTINVDGTTYVSDWMFADFDYWLRMGDVETTKHHIVMIPRGIVGSAVMNDTNTTAGGYKDSKMWTTTLPKYASAIKSAFGNDHVLTHRNLYSASVKNSGASMAGGGLTGATGTEWVWTDTICSLMSEPMVYGGMICASSAYDIWCAKRQFSIFRLSNTALNIRSDWWLSSVGSSLGFAYCYDVGYADNSDASLSFGVRPYFLLA